MAKVSFLKLALPKTSTTGNLDINGQTVEVKKYLPVDEKLELIEEVINQSHDENNFPNPLKVEVFFTIAIVKYYTNITFTEKQLETPTKIYDMLILGGFDLIKEMIPADEYNHLKAALDKTLDAIYAYRNSVLGILDSVSTDYSNLDLDAAEIQKTIADPNNLALLKDVLTKLG